MPPRKRTLEKKTMYPWPERVAGAAQNRVLSPKQGLSHQERGVHCLNGGVRCHGGVLSHPERGVLSRYIRGVLSREHGQPMSLKRVARRGGEYGDRAALATTGALLGTAALAASNPNYNYAPYGTYPPPPYGAYDPYAPYGPPYPYVAPVVAPYYGYGYGAPYGYGWGGHGHGGDHGHGGHH